MFIYIHEVLSQTITKTSYAGYSVGYRWSALWTKIYSAQNNVIRSTNQDNDAQR